MQADIDKHIEEKKQLQHQLVKTRRDHDEIKAMQIEETQRIYYDTQYYKDKVEKLKLELSSIKKTTQINEKYKELYEEIKKREEDREK